VHGGRGSSPKMPPGHVSKRPSRARRGRHLAGVLAFRDVTFSVNNRWRYERQPVGGHQDAASRGQLRLARTKPNAAHEGRRAPP
jgi:hypothetical protein